MKVFIPFENHGNHGQYFPETPAASFDQMVDMIIAGDYEPAYIFSFDPVKCDVSKKVAAEVIERAWAREIELPEAAKKFAARHGVTVPEFHRKLAAHGGAGA